MRFEQAFEDFMASQIAAETNGRRKERLEQGLGHAEIEFLRAVWFPTIGNFDNLYPEWEVRDLANGYRYLDFAYMPGDARGAIEVQGYTTHARDLELWRFKDLCQRHCHLALDGWLVMPIAYPSIMESPKLCQQLMLSLVGRFISSAHIPTPLTWVESEAIRFARRLMRPISPSDLATHLQVSTRYARKILHVLCDKKFFVVSNGQTRARLYRLNV